MARAFLIVMVAVLIACSKPVTVERAEVVGTYVVYVQGARDELTLRADGTYRHLVPSRIVGRTPRVDEGESRLESGSDSCTLRNTAVSGRVGGPSRWRSRHVRLVNLTQSDYRLLHEPPGQLR